MYILTPQQKPIARVISGQPASLWWARASWTQVRFPLIYPAAIRCLRLPTIESSLQAKAVLLPVEYLHSNSHSQLRWPTWIKWFKSEERDPRWSFKKKLFKRHSKKDRFTVSKYNSVNIKDRIRSSTVSFCSTLAESSCRMKPSGPSFQVRV